MLKRLNATREAEEKEAKKRYEYDTAFVDSTLLDEFEARLKLRASSIEHVNSSMSSINKYILNFFINKKQLSTPKLWKKYETDFQNFLIKKKLSVQYIKKIIQLANHLIKFIHNKYPDEIPLFELENVSRNAVKNKEFDERTKYIKKSDYEKIIEKCDERILPLVKIAYLYGRRRAETLALTTDNIYEDFLSAEQQVTKTSPIVHYSKLKNREKREVPHWFCSAEDFYLLVNQIQIIHPDTISDLFKKCMADLKLEYQFHDLRRTFITNALREHHFLDVRLAVGHTGLETTQKYIQDDRQMQRKKFKPKMSVVK